MTVIINLVFPCMFYIHPRSLLDPGYPGYRKQDYTMLTPTCVIKHVSVFNMSIDLRMRENNPVCSKMIILKTAADFSHTF